LDVSVLTSPKQKTTPSQDTSVTQGAQFPIRDNTPDEEEDPNPVASAKPVDSDPKPDTPAKPVEKKPLNVDDKPRIEVRDEEEDGNNQDPNAPEQAESPVKAIAEYLKAQGVVDYSDEEFKDEDNFIADTVAKSITKGVDTWKDSLPEEVKQIITNYQEGVNIPDLIEKEREILEYGNINPDSLKDSKELQKTLIHNLYAEQGWNQEDITEKLQELEDSGILEKEANRSLTKLKAFAEQQKQDMIATARQQKQDGETRYKEQIAKLQTNLKDKKEFIAGLNTNELEKKVVFDGITKFDNTGKNAVMKFMDNPENYMLVSYIANVLKGDFSKVKTAAKTGAIQDIKKTIDSTPKKSAFSGINTSIMKKSLNL
jgi:hypothetical protein